MIAHCGINQVKLWERWFAQAHVNDRDRIKFIWWMDPSASETNLPSSTLFNNNNRYRSFYHTYRYHHTQAQIALDMLEYAYQKYGESCNHYYLITGACIPIKRVSYVLSLFDKKQSYIWWFTSEDEDIANEAKKQKKKWITRDICCSHFQFVVFSSYHARVLMQLLKQQPQCWIDCIDVQKKLFNFSC
jgi:hypothetical protein